MAVQPIAREPTYTDIDLAFTRNRVTDDLDVIKGLDAIKNSIKNLVRTNFYEKPFRHSIGSPVRTLLFDNISALTSTFIKDAIMQTITNYEPRVNVTNILVEPNPDENRYHIALIVEVKNLLQPVIIDFFLNRIR